MFACTFKLKITQVLIVRLGDLLEEPSTEGWKESQEDEGDAEGDELL